MLNIWCLYHLCESSEETANLNTAQHSGNRQKPSQNGHPTWYNAQAQGYAAYKFGKLLGPAEMFHFFPG